MDTRKIPKHTTGGRLYLYVMIRHARQEEDNGVSARWCIYIDILGFSEFWEDERSKALASLRCLMLAIYRIGTKVYPNDQKRLLVHQMGDGFAIVSDFGEASLERPIAIAIALMRCVATTGASAPPPSFAATLRSRPSLPFSILAALPEYSVLEDGFETAIERCQTREQGNSHCNIIHLSKIDERRQGMRRQVCDEESSGHPCFVRHCGAYVHRPSLQETG